ncbi:MAG: hypothetical protein Q4D38_10990 [Planctomycetia bacterium]|nr:hypothetical protein [Planctomycetia bacterium]
MKVKFDPDSLKDLGINHAEKAIFALLILYILSIVWSSLGVTGLDKEPQQLQQIVSQADENLKRDQKITTPIENYLAVVDSITTPIELQHLEAGSVWDPILFPARRKREAPTILPIVDLHAAAYRGKVQRPQRMRAADEYGEEEDDGYAPMPMETGPQTRGFRCCIVTGAIPLRKQIRAFEDALGVPADRISSAIDEPTYYAYEVQRAEVPLDGNMNNLKWVSIEDTRDLADEKWENRQRLAELFGIASEGGMMMSSVASVSSGPREQDFEPPILKDYPAADDLDAEATRTGTLGVVDERGLVPTGFTFKMPLPSVILNSNKKLVWHGKNGIAELPQGIDFARKVRTTTSRTRRPVETTSEKTVEPLRFFRFLDYTVEPGKKYVYRARVFLHNPNYNYKPAHYVANAEIMKSAYLESPWSQTSTTATVQRDERFLFPGYRKLVEAKGGPSMSLLLVRFEVETGEESHALFDGVRLEPPAPPKKSKSKSRTKKLELPPPLLPGQLLSLFAPEAEDENQLSSAYTTYQTDSQYADLEEERSQIQYTERDTQFLILDSIGGKSELHKQYTAPKTQERTRQKTMLERNPEAIYTPSKVLLASPSGELMIQSELVDFENVFRFSRKEETQEIIEEPTVEPDRKGRRPKKDRSSSLKERRQR